MGYCPICKDSHVYWGYTECRNIQKQRKLKEEQEKVQQKLKEEQEKIKMETKSLERQLRKIKLLSKKFTELQIKATRLASDENMETTSRKKLDSDDSKMEKDLLKLDNSLDLIIEEHRNIKSITKHMTSGKKDLISNIELELKLIKHETKIIKSKRDSIETHATDEEAAKQTKFAKDTPREVKRGDRGTGLRNSKDIHGIDGDQSGEYRGGRRSNYEGY
jgi:DNA repair exonuclease SbcCD ATPase subunit